MGKGNYEIRERRGKDSQGAVQRRKLQAINYLKATGKQLGLWVSFGHYPKLEHEQFFDQALSRISRIS
jgi:hypothetical protein